jgi:hypothetical protein
MRRVHGVYLLRKLLTTSMLSIVALVLAVWGVGREVWVAHVLHNMPSPLDIPGVVAFFTSAFYDTRSIVQMLIIVAIVAIALALVNSIRFITYVSRDQFNFA